jgi:hypothetical protein
VDAIAIEYEAVGGEGGKDGAFEGALEDASDSGGSELEEGIGLIWHFPDIQVFGFWHEGKTILMPILKDAAKTINAHWDHAV